MTRETRAVWLALLVGTSLLWTAPAAAQGIEVSDDQVNAIAKTLYCPVCENVPLDVCPTQACAQWRAVIRQMLEEGKTEEEIQQYFVEQYGARVLATPPPSGLNWLVYVIPLLAFVAGVYVVASAFRSWRRGPSGAEPAAPATPHQDPYIARVEEELQRRR